LQKERYKAKLGKAVGFLLILTRNVGWPIGEQWPYQWSTIDDESEWGFRGHIF
jgi:hypothetical protein